MAYTRIAVPIAAALSVAFVSLPIDATAQGKDAAPGRQPPTSSVLSSALMVAPIRAPAPAPAPTTKAPTAKAATANAPAAKATTAKAPTTKAATTKAPTTKATTAKAPTKTTKRRPHPTTTTVPTATTVPAPVPPAGWSTPACDLMLTPGAELGGALNSTGNQGKTICLPDGSYSLTQTQHVAGIKVYALHQYQAKILGWIETYAAGDEWHGVYVDNSVNNPSGQGLQVYADNFVFVDSIFTNHLLSGGFFLGSPSYGIAHNVLIARNKIFQIGKQPGGTGGTHPFYADYASGKITDNWLWGNLGFGIQFYPHAFALSFSYNVVAGEQQAAVMFASDGANNVASHNIITNTATGFDSYQQTGSGAQADHTWFSNVATSYTGGGYTQAGGDGSGAPQFANAATNNYNLTAGSPATGYGPRVTLP